MAKNKAVATLISSLSGELVTTTLDFVVLTAALAGGLILFGPRGKDIYAEKHFNDALKATALMYKKWDESKFRRSVGRALGKGLIKRAADGFQLTESGEQRLKSLLPEYKKPVLWDGKLWLVTYDIPNDKKRSRDRFRRWLFKIGCRMIQESVWVSVKDPRPWVREAIQAHRKGSVIVSCLGRDGSIGEETLEELLYRVFKLKKVENAYRQWLTAAGKLSEGRERTLRLGMRYVAILKLDPCLPIDLLPRNWPGEKARKMFESEIKPMMGELKEYL